MRTLLLLIVSCNVQAQNASDNHVSTTNLIVADLPKSNQTASPEAVKAYFKAFYDYQGIYHTDMMAFYYYARFNYMAEKVAWTRYNKWLEGKDTSKNHGKGKSKGDVSKSKDASKSKDGSKSKDASKEDVTEVEQSMLSMALALEASKAEGPKLAAVASKVQAQNSEFKEPKLIEKYIQKLDFLATWFDLLANLHISTANYHSLTKDWSEIGALYKAYAAEKKEKKAQGTTALVKAQATDASSLYPLLRKQQSIKQAVAFLSWQHALILSEVMHLWTMWGNKAVDAFGKMWGKISVRLADWCFYEWWVSTIMDTYQINKNAKGDKLYAVKIGKVMWAFSFISNVKAILAMTYAAEVGFTALADTIPFYGMMVAHSAIWMDTNARWELYASSSAPKQISK